MSNTPRERPVGAREGVEAIRRAIRDEGPVPKVHRETMARHAREWPTLWDAIDRLLAEQSVEGVPPGHEWVESVVESLSTFDDPWQRAVRVPDDWPIGTRVRITRLDPEAT